MNITWTETAWKEYVNWQTKDKDILRKINELIKDILRYGYYGVGKPENHPFAHKSCGCGSGVGQFREPRNVFEKCID